MIKEAFGDGEDSSGASMAPKVMLPLAVATSIDALAAGLTLALLKVNVFASCLMIGLTIGADDESLKRSHLPRNLIRIHVGQESVDAMKSDLEGAFSALEQG